MTATTDTLTSPSETAGRETTSPPEAQPPSTSRRSALAWIAVALAGIAVAALAFATFTGGDDRRHPGPGLLPGGRAIRAGSPPRGAGPDPRRRPEHQSGRQP